MRGKKLTPEEKADIIIAYQTNLVPMLELAKKYGKSRAGIWKTLQKAGVNTTKRRLPVTCHACGKQVLKPKCQIRKAKYCYCTFDCYMEYIRETGQSYVKNRGGQRRARSAVGRHFELKENMIVHHENKDTLDNRLTNLRVFSDHSEHMRYHRSGEAIPLWDGREISL